MDQADLAFFCPAQHAPRGELRSVIGAHTLWLAASLDQPIQFPCHSTAAETGVSLQHQALAGERIDHAEDAGENLLFVPTTSVVTTTERTFVITVINGKAHWVDMRKGPAAGENVSVRGQVDVGQEIVKRASDEIREGTPLR